MQDAELEKILVDKLSPLRERTYADSIAAEVQDRIAVALARRQRSRRLRPWLIALAVALGSAISAPSVLATGWLTRLTALPERLADASAAFGAALTRINIDGTLASNLTDTLSASGVTEASALTAMGVLLVLLFGWLMEGEA